MFIKKPFCRVLDIARNEQARAGFWEVTPTWKQTTHKKIHSQFEEVLRKLVETASQEWNCLSSTDHYPSVATSAVWLETHLTLVFFFQIIIVKLWNNCSCSFFAYFNYLTKSFFHFFESWSQFVRYICFVQFQMIYASQNQNKLLNFF